MKFTNKDGELRLYEGGATPYYHSVLFTQGDLTFPTEREKVEEVLNMDRGNYTNRASYSEGPDSPIIEPLPLSFSALLDDTLNTNVLASMLSGITRIWTDNSTLDNQDVTTATTKADSTLNIQRTAVATVSFADSSKITYNIELLLNTVGGVTYGWKLMEVYFPPGQQTITEGPDGVALSANGLFYGSAATLNAFSSGSSI